MATEFDDSQHYGIFTTSPTLTSQTGKMVRQSELTLAALRAQGVFDTMVDSTTAPTTDKLWLDKNSDPAVLKEWDSIGSAWVPMTFDRLFGRAIVTELTNVGGTANAITVDAPATFISNRLYSLTPTADNTGATTIQVTGVGTYAAKYHDGTDVGAKEFVSGQSKPLLFANGRFEVIFPVSALYIATAAAQAAADAAVAAAASIDYITVADRTALKAVDTGAHSAAFLKDAQHTATFDSSDLSAEITAAAGDESLYVAPNSDPTGASGAWVLAADSGLYFKPRPVEAPALVRNVGDWMRTQRKLGDFGAVGTSDDSTTWQTAVDEMAGIDGGMLELPSGITTVQSAIDLDLTSVANYGSNTGMDIVGPGSGHCMVVVDHAGEFLNISNNNGIANTRIRGLKIRGSGARSGVGLVLDNTSYMVFEDVFFSNLEYGTKGTDFFSSVFRDCQWNLNKYGINIAGRDDLSSINALSFENCRVTNNYEQGLYVKNPSLFRWIGGNCEGNGRLGSGATVNRYGMYFDTPNTNGNMNAAIIDGCWFERNAGNADIVLLNVDDDVLFKITNNNFLRADGTYYTNANIILSLTGSGNVRCIRPDNTHAGYSPYVASSSRKYYQISESSTGKVVFEGRSLEADATEREAIRGGTVIASLVLNMTGTATFTSAFNVASITDNGPGDFTITYKAPALLSANKFSAVGFDGYATVFSESTSSLRLRFYASGGTTLTDFDGARIIIME